MKVKEKKWEAIFDKLPFILKDGEIIFYYYPSHSHIWYGLERDDSNLKSHSLILINYHLFQKFKRLEIITIRNLLKVALKCDLKKQPQLWLEVTIFSLKSWLQVTVLVSYICMCKCVCNKYYSLRNLKLNKKLTIRPIKKP